MNLELNELYLNPALYIARSETHRWGVFTRDDIKANDVLQESPYCTFPEEEIENSDIIVRYAYGVTEDFADDYVIGFGFAALFNHSSDEYNAAFQLDTVNEVMRHYAVEDIPAGSEIYIDYDCEDDDEWGDYWSLSIGLNL